MTQHNNLNSELLEKFVELKAKLDLHLTLSNKADEVLNDIRDKFIAQQQIIIAQQEIIKQLQEQIKSLEEDREEHCKILHKGTVDNPAVLTQLAIIRQEGKDREKRLGLMLGILALVFTAIQVYQGFHK